MKLVFVIGMPGGGTSAVAGILTKNGFWNRGYNDPYFEDRHAACLYTSTLWYKPSSLPDNDIVVNYFEKYNQDAIDAGYDKAVSKIAWHMLWSHEVLAKQDIEVLLVARDPITNGKSIVHRFGARPGGRDAYELAAEGQHRIWWLNEKYGWPVWTFGKNSDIKDLESILGVGLPNKWFEGSKVRF